MTKKTDERGETKSAPPEIAKLARTTCTKCGLAAPAPMVVRDGTSDFGACSNVFACGKRAARNERRKAT